ncbi:hypothetical protein VTK73DRAFT_1630 [Phialemonium thermophilum]|uniref:N-acetyltransferase domain-containing protein n=1 Tax=Phialemonium thermophilum TaxID=223376 RepID=A0ABR3VT97_9PEZI
MPPLGPSLPPGYALCTGYPSPEEYLHLRATSGLSPKALPQATAALAGSWYGCYITYIRPGSDPRLPPEKVAMGRVIGDGGWYFLIADMAVLPEHQRRGLGDAVLKHLVDEIRRRKADGSATIALFADPPGRKLYARNGFVETAPGSVGMVAYAT